jgi:transcriptional regulator with XRE-family HTH domain
LYAGLTQKQAAERLKISKNTLANYEAYKTMPSYEKGKEMASLYGISVDIIRWKQIG